MKKKFIFLALFSGLLLTGCSAQIQNSTSSSVKTSTSEKTFSNSTASSSEDQSVSDPSSTITQQLIQYTNQQSAGPNDNYYLDNGVAQLSGFETMSAGNYAFKADSQGRSSEARAVLTYQEFKDSKGKRQGSPLDPPSWPENEKIAITFSLTNRTYHGYLYNRSHSISDGLLGKASYSSKYNFTTGTRSQNVGANQKGGMRAAEELAENYWKEHPETQATIQYETRPIYNGDETIPRGSIVDEKSSDGALNKEIVVINSAEGLKIDYYTGLVK